METKQDIITRLANENRVEKIVCNISHKEMDADLSDLAQMVYLILLEYDEDKVLDLWSNNQINFFIVRIVMNQYQSVNSPFHISVRKFRELSESIEGMDWENE